MRKGMTVPVDVLIKATVSGPYLSSDGIAWMRVRLLCQSKDELYVLGTLAPKKEDWDAVMVNTWKAAGFELKELPQREANDRE